MARHDPIFAFIWIALGVFLCPASYRPGEDYEKVIMKSEAAVTPLIKAAGL